MTSRSAFQSHDQEQLGSIQLQEEIKSSNQDHATMPSTSSIHGNSTTGVLYDSSLTNNPKYLKPSESSLSLALSSGAISLPASFCDTDAALFTFDYEMLNDIDVACDEQGFSNSLTLKQRLGAHIHGDHIPVFQGNDIEKGEDHDTPLEHEFILFGIDLSYLSGNMQLAIAAAGVLFFNMLYGLLQELIQIQIAGRGFALFLGACQFAGYTFWSWILSRLRSRRIRLRTINTVQRTGKVEGEEYTLLPSNEKNISKCEATTIASTTSDSPTKAPLMTYFALSVIRAIDLGLTNLSMKYLNYPAKTLIKSSRVVFTMIMGIVIGGKKYKKSDYAMVAMLVVGLGMFLHADMATNAIFHPLGVLMLVSVSKASFSEC
jgi:hypothetical protein